MKLLGITIILLYAAQGWVAGQGAINFNNRALNLNPAAVNAPIYGPSGALLTGTGYTAQLWAAPAQGPGGLAPLSTTTMRPPGSLAGYIIPPPAAPTVNNAPHGTLVIFNLRVWDNQNNTITSWAMVMANPCVLRGESGNFVTAVAEPPNPPPNLVGLTSFSIGLPFACPEPSILALAGLALPALLFLRMRK